MSVINRLSANQQKCFTETFVTAGKTEADLIPMLSTLESVKKVAQGPYSSASEKLTYNRNLGAVRAAVVRTPTYVPGKYQDQALMQLHATFQQVHQQQLLAQFPNAVAVRSRG